MKEMNGENFYFVQYPLGDFQIILFLGRYVGSRPIKLRKSTWRSRALDAVRKKEKEKAALISLLTGGASKS